MAKFIVVSLNTEAGCRSGFLEYITLLAENPLIWVLCFQEVHHITQTKIPEKIHVNDLGGKEDNPIRPNLYNEIEKILGNGWTGKFQPQLTRHLHDRDEVDYPIDFGQATFVRKTPEVKILGQSSGTCFRQVGEANDERSGGKPSAKAMIETSILICGEAVTIGNVHGFWSMHGKKDMLDRFVQNLGIGRRLLSQSQSCNLIDREPKILLVGDLNYHSKMEALEHLRKRSVFGERPGVNLNARFGISNTRTTYYPAEKPSREADYAIASSSLASKVTNVWVDPTAPSDHAALFVELCFE